MVSGPQAQSRSADCVKFEDMRYNYVNSQKTEKGRCSYAGKYEIQH